MVFFFFFFSSRRRHTRWPRDWSSDVCSSDLGSAKYYAGEGYSDTRIQCEDSAGCCHGILSEPRRLYQPREYYYSTQRPYKLSDHHSLSIRYRGGKADHPGRRSEEHTSELQSRGQLVCRL